MAVVKTVAGPVSGVVEMRMGSKVQIMWVRGFKA
jgi:hypothetical protein